MRLPFRHARGASGLSVWNDGHKKPPSSNILARRIDQQTALGQPWVHLDGLAQYILRFRPRAPGRSAPTPCPPRPQCDRGQARAPSQGHPAPKRNPATKTRHRRAWFIALGIIRAIGNQLVERIPGRSKVIRRPPVQSQNQVIPARGRPVPLPKAPTVGRRLPGPRSRQARRANLPSKAAPLRRDQVAADIQPPPAPERSAPNN